MGKVEGGHRVITAIAIDRDKNSQYAVKWTVDNLLKKNSSPCVLVHVRCQSLHPGDVDFVAKGGRPPTEEELKQFFLPYRGFCARKGVDAKEIVLHDIDVPSALIDFAVANGIINIVVGTSSRNALTRKFKNPDVPTSLLKSAPVSCSIYVVRKNKLRNHRPASQPSTPIGTPNSNNNFTAPDFPREMDGHAQAYTPDSFDLNRSTCSIGSYKSESSDSTYSGKSRESLPPTSYSRRRAIPKSPTPMGTYIPGKCYDTSSSGCSNDFSSLVSFQSMDMSFSSDASTSASENSVCSLVSQNTTGMEAEMARLRLEFEQSLRTYDRACRDADAADQWAKTGDVRKPEQLNPKEVQLSLPDPEKQQRPVAPQPPQIIQQRRAMLAQHKETAEVAAPDVTDRNAMVESIVKAGVPYKRYSIEDIERVTDNFSDKLKIGEGGYGPVYKATLDYIPVAIKILRSDVSQGQLQFKQEVEVLSSIRHPNMVHLVGACPEYGCLIYEYMDYGSLEDRLFCKDSTPPIPWRTRFKIAAEIASGLFFLHQTKPEPLVHRDIKPSNILLDSRYASKISDVGLARLVPASVANMVTEYHMTAAAGTFCYIDPEYQQTGMLGVKSDVYSFGVMLLQLLTGRQPMGLAMTVEEAIEGGTFYLVLDPAVKGWPYKEALSMAKLAIRCCELRRRDRPDLGTEVLPELNRLKRMGMADEIQCDLIVDDME